MKLPQKIADFLWVTVRIWKYSWLSDAKNVKGKPILYHPLLLKGKGKISFGNHVTIGVKASPLYYSHYTFLEARTKDSEIEIGDHVAISNGFSVEAYSKITIKSNVLIGVNCSVTDNDGHHLEPEKRNETNLIALPVLIEENVFVGDNVSILKGVTIGRNSVIGKGSVVTNDIPENAVAAGIPAKVIRFL